MSDLLSELDDFPIEELKAAAGMVPFGQSAFQNVHLADDARTPARKLRYVLLQLNQRLCNLKDCEFRRRRLDIDLREAKDGLEKSPNSFNKERLLLTIEEKEWGLAAEEKLICDALLEVRTFVAMWRALPKVESREVFEAAELEHWRAKFIDTAKLELLATGTLAVGTADALGKVGITWTQEESGEIRLQIPAGLEPLEDPQ